MMGGVYPDTLTRGASTPSRPEGQLSVLCNRLQTLMDRANTVRARLYAINDRLIGPVPQGGVNAVKGAEVALPLAQRAHSSVSTVDDTLGEILMVIDLIEGAL